jgi:hypothetical protein
VMSFAIALVSLAIAALAAARTVLPALDARLASWGMALGIAVVVTVAAAYAIALRLTRDPQWNA